MMYTLFHLFFPLVNQQQAFPPGFHCELSFFFFFFLHVYLKLSITQLHGDVGSFNF